MIAKEKAKRIRAALRKEGIKAYVRSGCCGYSDYVDITINDLSVDRERVEKIAYPYESVQHDERTYEVLEGGNTYIRIEYNYDMLQEAEKKMIPKAEEVLKACEGLGPHEGKKFGKLSVFPSDGITFLNGRSFRRFEDAQDMASIMVDAGCF